MTSAAFPEIFPTSSPQLQTMHLNIQANTKEIPVPMCVVLLDAAGGTRRYLDAYVILLLVEWSVDVMHHAQLMSMNVDIDLGKRRLKGGVPLEKRLYANTFHRFPQQVASWVVRETPVLALETVRTYGYLNVVPFDADGKPKDSHLSDAELVEITQALSLMDREEDSPTVDKKPDSYKVAGDPIRIKGRKAAWLPDGNRGGLVGIGPDGKPLPKKTKTSQSKAKRKAGSKKAAVPKAPGTGTKKGEKISLAQAVQRINPDRAAKELH